jgi:hypothetical protein
VKVFHQHCHQVQIGDKCFYVVKEEDIEDEGNGASSTLGNQGERKILLKFNTRKVDETLVVYYLSTHVKVSQLVNKMCSQQACSKLVNKL